jgi:hypothetical protein
MLGCESIVCHAQAFIRQPARDAVEKMRASTCAMPGTGQTMLDAIFQQMILVASAP